MKKESYNLSTRKCGIDLCESLPCHSPQESVNGDGSIVLIDPMTLNSQVSVDDFRLRTLVENGVNIEDVGTISQSRLSMAQSFESNFNVYTNVEQILKSQENANN